MKLLCPECGCTRPTTCDAEVAALRAENERLRKEILTVRVLDVKMDANAILKGGVMTEQPQPATWDNTTMCFGEDCPNCAAEYRKQVEENAALRAERDDPMHPTGRCICAGEGRCWWCRWDAMRERAEEAEERVAELEAKLSRVSDELVQRGYRAP